MLSLFLGSPVIREKVLTQCYLYIPKCTMVFTFTYNFQSVNCGSLKIWIILIFSEVTLGVILTWSLNFAHQGKISLVQCNLLDFKIFVLLENIMFTLIPLGNFQCLSTCSCLGNGDWHFRASTADSINLKHIAGR